MEIKIEAADGCNMPNGSYVAVKLGDSLKQGRYAPSMSYVFPKANKRHTAKIDIFKHVGTSTLLVTPESGCNTREIDVASSDPLVEDLRLRIDMKPSDSEEKVIAANVKSAAREQAASYLEKHRIEEKLATSMKLLLQKQPDDPIEFLCCSLRGVPQEAPPARFPAQSNSTANRNLGQSRVGENVEQALDDSSSIRQAACRMMAQASNDGRLLDLLHQSKQECAMQEAPQKASIIGGLNVENFQGERLQDLRVQATELLICSSKDGSLREAVASTKKKSDNVIAESLRGDVCSLLSVAARDGRLEKALADGWELRSHVQQVQGLAKSAVAIANINPVSAAGLARAAVAKATSLPVALDDRAGTRDPVGILIGLAEMAASAAENRSATAPGLIKATAEASITIVSEIKL